MAEINEVKLNGKTILSTRSNTVTEDTLVQGETAQTKAGESIVGRLDPVDKDKAYLISDEIGDIDNADYMPFYDTSEQKKKKTLFGSIVEKLKSVFAQKTDLKAHTFEVGTEIPENADLNNYTTAGVYTITPDAKARTISNIPYAKDTIFGGKLIVLEGLSFGNAYKQQIYLDHENYIFRRRFTGSVWSSWDRLGSAFEEMNMKYATEISNIDLDDLKDFGFYDWSMSNASTISNRPTSGNESALLYVFASWNNNNHRRQIVFMRDSDDYYTRITYDGTTWTDWKKVASTDDITPSTVGNGYAVTTVSGSAITATISGFKLRAGVIVALHISTAVTVDCTLNINNTGAKSVKTWNDEAINFGHPLSFGIHVFIYDGTYYRVIAQNRTPLVGIQNYVADTGGNELIEWGYGNNRAQIKHIIGSNKLSWNYYKNSAWRGDVKIADFDDLITQLGTQIPENSDLNDYTTAGVFRVQTGTIASTISNIPLANSGKLIVMVLTGYSNDWLTQIYIPNHNDWIYRRRLSDNTGDWSSWVEYVNDFDAGASIAKTGKSILPIWRHSTNTISSNGVTATFNPLTGEITLNGTATAKTYFPLYSGKNLPSYEKLPKGTYVLSGCPSGGSSTTYELDFYCSKGSWFDHGSGVTFSLSSDADLNDDWFIFVASGQTVSNLVFKPMLRPAFTTADYEPCEDIHKGNCYVGTCTTAGATKDKVAYVDGYFVLRKGVRVAIKYSNTNTYSSTTSSPVTLNVNGTGAKNIWYGTTHSGAGNTGTLSGVYGLANGYVYYVFDGTYWVWDGRTGDNDTTDPRVLGFGYGTCATSESTTAKVVTLSNYVLRTGGYVSVKFTYAVPANSTMNINSRGAKNIWYRGANITSAIIKAGDLATFIYDGSHYLLIGIDRDSIDKRNCISMSDLVFGSTVTFVKTTGSYTVRGDINGNMLHFNMEVNFTDSGTIPSDSDSTGGFFVIKGYSLDAWTMVHVEYNANYYPAYCSSGTFNGTQGICVRLRRALTVNTSTPLKLCFDAVLSTT